MNITPCASRYPCYAPSKMPVGGMELMNAKGLGKGGKGISFVTRTKTNFPSSAQDKDRKCGEMADISMTTPLTI